MDDAHEAVGLRDNGDVYAVEVLGQQTESFAADLAQQLSAAAPPYALCRNST